MRAPTGCEAARPSGRHACAGDAGVLRAAAEQPVQAAAAAAGSRVVGTQLKGCGAHLICRPGCAHAQVMQASFGRPLSSLYGQQLPLSVAQPADACQRPGQPRRGRRHRRARPARRLLLRGQGAAPPTQQSSTSLCTDAPVRAWGLHWCGAATWAMCHQVPHAGSVWCSQAHPSVCREAPNPAVHCAAAMQCLRCKSLQEEPESVA